MQVALLAVYGSGGVVDYTSRLAGALSELVDVRVIAPDTPEVRSAIPSGLLEAYGQQSWKGRKLWEIRSGLRSVDPDVVHLPFYGPMYDAMLAPLLAARNTPLVGTLHDPAPHSGLGRRVLGVDVHTTARRLAANVLDAVFVHGEYSRGLAVDLGYDPGKLVTIPHGVYDQYADGDSPTEPGTLLLFGYIRPNKGYDRIPTLLDAVEERVSGVTAVVAGTPDWNNTNDEAALASTLEALRRDDRVELHDRYVDAEEVPEFFSRAQVVVLPYRDATTSGVAMIAYGMEKPIVATDVGELGRMVREDGSGLLADPAVEGDLARQVVRMLTSESLRRDCVRNVHEAKERYTWDAVAEQTVAVYEDVVSGRR